MEGYGSRSIREYNSNITNNIYKEKEETWMIMSSNQIGRGFSWPPRSYSCSFCKREFRSAQALGGHMNIHRRDKARLRQSSPPLAHLPTRNPNLNLNLEDGGRPASYTDPIPNLNMPPPPVTISREEQKILQMTHTLFPFMLSPQPCHSVFPAVESLSDLSGIDGELLKADKFEEGMKDGPKKGSEILRLDLDLELRLGYI